MLRKSLRHANSTMSIFKFRGVDMRNLICFFLFFLSTPCFAGLFPAITSVSAKRLDNYYVEYSWTSEMVEVGSITNVFTYQGHRAAIYGVKRVMTTSTGIGVGPACQTTFSPLGNITIGTAGQNLFSLCSNKNSVKLYDRKDSYTSVCLGTFIGPTIAPGLWETLDPTGRCISLPESDEWCKITTPTLVFDHGVLSLKDAEGNRSTKTLSIMCTNQSKIKMSLIGNSKDTISLGSGGEARLTSSLGAFGSTFTVNAGNTNIDITSQLKNVTPGQWSASAVLMIEPV